ncbi:hypothetical protein RF11_05471 [Thelohanellus kitauei]|uniref:CCHC-type domain-containing protein n=1 Tax=Thelohanellus kitauei TaxID=669202 RepID=A0A0C2MSL6_THEKT|nr:hypothetical protein RF11_05471 [Thelohanellus kitauei]
MNKRALWCDCCGSQDHMRINCPHGDKNFFNCGVKGYLSAICMRSRPTGSWKGGNTRKTNASDKVKNIEPFYLSLKINDIDMRSTQVRLSPSLIDEDFQC